MERAFIETPIFMKRWSELGLTDDDLREFQAMLSKNPQKGEVIVGSGGLRKIRYAIPRTVKGKRGGVRTLYVDFMHIETIALIDCYGKGQKDNISDEEKAEYKKLIKTFKGE